MLAVPDDWDEPFAIILRITGADGAELFAGETSTARMKRSFAELAGWLVRDNPVPPGSVLLTGTGLVPADDYTLSPATRSRSRSPGSACSSTRSPDLVHLDEPGSKTKGEE